MSTTSGALESGGAAVRSSPLPAELILIAAAAGIIFAAIATGISAVAEKFRRGRNRSGGGGQQKGQD